MAVYSAATIGEAGYAMHSLARFYVVGGGPSSKGKVEQVFIKRKKNGKCTFYISIID